METSIYRNCDLIARPGTGKEGAPPPEHTRGAQGHWWSLWPRASVSPFVPWVDIAAAIPGLRDSAWVLLQVPDSPSRRCWHEGPYCPGQIKEQRQELGQTRGCCLPQPGLKPRGCKGEGSQGSVRTCVWEGPWDPPPERPSGAAQPRSGTGEGSCRGDG